ncbi:unnamed protein product [Cyprideis torosa]|uniref:Carboxylic ester hydrolase n=1 Tax=Cyprideis torosa TaxID=163714 RepID=A0A7R8W3T6_9CRUS|nr:unnamed protein product [Cyprideis torosa]CAG0883391.1 unnamed protein product [Cyprideis torosa]
MASKTAVVTYLCAFLALVLSSPIQDDDSNKGLYDHRVETTLGPVIGTRATTTVPGLRQVYSFFGIPYAADTSGQNRFRPPQPRAPWTEDLDCTSKDRLKAGSCLQEDGLSAGTLQGSEDCLQLAVYSRQIPKWHTPNPNLPVMIFIYGGGFSTGDAQVYNHWKLLDHDIVLVVPNYRVGLLGFLSTHSDEAPGNAGLYDQLEALKWVQANIANFGGDPNRVTIFGESAGAVSVAHHVLSPLSAGLFQQAILQSGCPLSAWAVEENPLAYHEAFGPFTGCPWDPAHADDYVRCLRTIDGHTLITKQNEMIKSEMLQGRHGFRGISPVIQVTGGGQPSFITEQPAVSLSEGRFNRVPMIFGANKHEGSFVLGLVYEYHLEPLNLVNDLEFFNNEMVGRIAKMLEVAPDDDHPDSAPLIQTFDSHFFGKLPRDSFNSTAPGLIDFLGAAMLKNGTYNMAQMMVAHGIPTWFYSFEYAGEHSLFSFLFTEDLPFAGGVGHGDELIYQFGIPVLLNADDFNFAKSFIQLWVNFARDGNPSSDWPQLTASGEEYMVIDSPMSVRNGFRNTFTVAAEEYVANLRMPGYDHIKTHKRDRLEAEIRMKLLEGKKDFTWTEADEEEVQRKLNKESS